MEDVVDKALRMGLSPDNMVREALQRLILYSITSANLDKYYIFQGGTALRIMYGSPRFSLDIDFSLIHRRIGVVTSDVKKIMNVLVKALSIEKIDVYIARERTVGNGGLYRCYFTFDTRRFIKKRIRVKLEVNKVRYRGITFPRMIVDLEYPFKTSVAILVKNPNQLLSDKVASLAGGFHRNMIRWRDIFDIYWIRVKLNGDIDKTYLRREFGSWIETIEDLRELAQRLGELYHGKKYRDAIDELQRLLPPNLSRRELIPEYIRETLNVLNKAMEMIR